MEKPNKEPLETFEDFLVANTNISLKNISKEHLEWLKTPTNQEEDEYLNYIDHEGTRIYFNDKLEEKPSMLNESTFALDAGRYIPIAITGLLFSLVMSTTSPLFLLGAGGCIALLFKVFKTNNYN